VASSDERRLGVGLKGLVHLGITPAVSVGGALSVELRLGAFGMGLEGRIAHSVIPYEHKPTPTIRIPIHWLFGAATVAPCYYYRFFVGCAVLTGGALESRGPSDLITYTRKREFFAAGLRPEVRWSFAQRFALTGNVEISAVLRGPAFRADEGVIWRPFPIFAAFGVGILANLADIGAGWKSGK
jgi:hypothetical protein